MDSPTTNSLRRVQRVRYELKRRELTVARVQRVGAHFAAITFTGDALADFQSGSFDDHVKFFLAGADGQPVGRDYTPRAFDTTRRELTIEFLLHGEGPAGDWAAGAKPGDTATIGGPRGSMVIPADYPWHLLVGDESALPAISRRLEELPAGTQASVRVQLQDPADARAFRSAATLDVAWVATAGELVQAVKGFTLPAGEGYVWAAGESSTMARLRDMLLVDKGHPREAARIAAYWKRGASGHHEHLD
jgi:NADPH-dependent ferric siderophore reductase